MPYILSPLVKENMEGLWFEGAPYEKENIYCIDGAAPPVNYDKHTFKSHSLTHAEGSLHTQADGKSVDTYFSKDFFYGRVTVVRLKGDNFKIVDSNQKIYHWEVELDELKDALKNKRPNKLILTVDNYPLVDSGYHDPDKVLTLSQEAADWLVGNTDFNLYGTSWKSTDYCPGSSDRPIHNTIFKSAVIIECLDLKKVPAGDYFLVAYPIRIEGASESPVTPVLFTADEILNIF